MALQECHECGGNVSSEAQACPHCGAPVKVSKTSNPKAKEFSTLQGCLIIILAVTVAVSWGTCDGGGGGRTTSRPRSTGRIAGTGDVTTVRVAGGEDVPVAISEEALDRLTQLSVAKDTTGIAQLMLAGLVWNVPSGTKIRVIESGIFSYEVRILEGAHSGKSCFVASDFVGKRRG